MVQMTPFWACHKRLPRTLARHSTATGTKIDLEPAGHFGYSRPDLEVGASWHALPKEGPVQRSSFLFLLALFGGAAYLFFQHYELKRIDGGWKITAKPADARRADRSTAPPDAAAGETIRVATFNIQVFGNSKLEKPRVMEVLAEIVRRFDVVAIQEIQSPSDDLLPRFIDLVNSAGRHYDYVISERVGRDSSTEQYAFVYDQSTIEVDRNQLYVVNDPDDVLHREPLVGWFRVRGPNPEEAFTFTLANIHVDPDDVEAELSALADVYRVVRNDGRDEDDVILLGDLNTDDRNLGPVGAISEIAPVIVGVNTNLGQSRQYDNLLIQRQATREFTGRSGVFDFLREYNLEWEEAKEVSDHLPVWAEFSAYEGGTPGQVADQGRRTKR